MNRRLVEMHGPLFGADIIPKDAFALSYVLTENTEQETGEIEAFEHALILVKGTFMVC